MTLDETNVRAKMLETNLPKLVDKFNNLERTISILAPVSHFIKPETQSGIHSLMAAGSFLDVLVPEGSIE